MIFLRKRYLLSQLYLTLFLQNIDSCQKREIICSATKSFSRIHMCLLGLGIFCNHLRSLMTTFVVKSAHQRSLPSTLVRSCTLRQVSMLAFVNECDCCRLCLKTLRFLCYHQQITECTLIDILHLCKITNIQPEIWSSSCNLFFIYLEI